MMAPQLVEKVQLTLGLLYIFCKIDMGDEKC